MFVSNYEFKHSLRANKSAAPTLTADKGHQEAWNIELAPADNTGIILHATEVKANLSASLDDKVSTVDAKTDHEVWQVEAAGRVLYKITEKSDSPAGVDAAVAAAAAAAAVAAVAAAALLAKDQKKDDEKKVDDLPAFVQANIPRGSEASYILVYKQPTDKDVKFVASPDFQTPGAAKHTQKIMEEAALAIGNAKAPVLPNDPAVLQAQLLAAQQEIVRLQAALAAATAAAAASTHGKK